MKPLIRNLLLITTFGLFSLTGIFAIAGLGAFILNPFTGPTAIALVIALGAIAAISAPILFFTGRVLFKLSSRWKKIKAETKMMEELFEKLENTSQEIENFFHEIFKRASGTTKPLKYWKQKGSFCRKMFEQYEVQLTLEQKRTLLLIEQKCLQSIQTILTERNNVEQKSKRTKTIEHVNSMLIEVEQRLTALQPQPQKLTGDHPTVSSFQEEEEIEAETEEETGEEENTFDQKNFYGPLKSKFKNQIETLGSNGLAKSTGDRNEKRYLVQNLANMKETLGAQHPTPPENHISFALAQYAIQLASAFPLHAPTLWERAKPSLEKLRQDTELGSKAQQHLTGETWKTLQENHKQAKQSRKHNLSPDNAFREAKDDQAFIDLPQAATTQQSQDPQATLQEFLKTNYPTLTPANRLDFRCRKLYVIFLLGMLGNEKLTLTPEQIKQYFDLAEKTLLQLDNTSQEKVSFLWVLAHAKKLDALKNKFVSAPMKQKEPPLSQPPPLPAESSEDTRKTMENILNHTTLKILQNRVEIEIDQLDMGRTLAASLNKLDEFFSSFTFCQKHGAEARRTKVQIYGRLLALAYEKEKGKTTKTMCLAVADKLSKALQGLCTHHPAKYGAINKQKSLIQAITLLRKEKTENTRRQKGKGKKQQTEIIKLKSYLKTSVGNFPDASSIFKSSYGQKISPYIDSWKSEFLNAKETEKLEKIKGGGKKATAIEVSFEHLLGELTQNKNKVRALMRRAKFYHELLNENTKTISLEQKIFFLAEQKKALSEAQSLLISDQKYSPEINSMMFDITMQLIPLSAEKIFGSAVTPPSPEEETEGEEIDMTEETNSTDKDKTEDGFEADQNTPSKR